MSAKENFTTAEWAQLLQAPMYAGMSIISSDVGLTSVPKETAAMIRAIVENPIPDGAGDVVGALVSDMKEMAENRDKMVQPEFTAKDPEGIKAEITAELTGIAALVDSKLSSTEAAGYKEWVYSVAQSVAEAGKEGGFLGIGAVRVSEQEEAALAALRTDLGLA